jgi:DUF2075 family protein/adenylylsulfate kinase-like enzyme
MYLKKLNVGDFINISKDIWQILENEYVRIFGFVPSDSEVISWKNSLPEMAKILEKCNSNVKECKIYLEFFMPGSSSRADILLAGLTKEKKRGAIIIELKQWDIKSIKIDGKNLRVGTQIYPHPSEQALSYRDYMAEMSHAFSDQEAEIRSCSYLHNIRAKDIDRLKKEPFWELVSMSPVFGCDQSEKIAGWISDILDAPPDHDFIIDLDKDTTKVSKTLFGTVAEAVRKNRGWTLLDDQITAYNEILNLITTSNDGEKHLVLISGGPGTGKSVIAMQLLGELSRRKIQTVHITNSSSFTTVMKSLVQADRDRKWGKKAVNGLFRLSHNWVRRKDNFEVAICDEAHRFRRSTNMYPFLVSNRSQAEEIFEHIRILVAFLDEKQRLRKAEEGTIDYFKECARNVGVKEENIHGPIELKVQFRCAGNDKFMQAFDRVLYQGQKATFSKNNFDFKICDSVEDLENLLREKFNEGFSVRLVAGFCWPWSDPDEKGHLISDVKINNWSRPWNRKAKGGESPDNHPYTIWATQLDDPLEQIGCIYSVQGFEFDYIGVIWGTDLVYRNNIGWIAKPENSFDTEMRSRNKITNPKIAMPLLKNAYRVLCSRGMKGCYIYCIDDETQNYLRNSLCCV